MKITPENISEYMELAATVALLAADIINKIKQVNDTKEPVTIDEELQRLEAARYRPSQEIIDEADKMMKGGGQ